MPTPLDILLGLTSLFIIAMYALRMIYEAVFPAKELPKIKFWKIRGIVFFFLFFYLSSYKI